jgi:hypothetical protein
LSTASGTQSASLTRQSITVRDGLIAGGIVSTGLFATAQLAGNTQSVTFYNPATINSGPGLSFAINAQNDLFLRAGRATPGQTSTRRIYIQSGLVNYTSDVVLRVPTLGGALPSTQIIKDNIESLNENEIIEIFDKIDIIKYTDLMSNETHYSLIIENELEKQNNLFKSLI